MVYVLDIAGKPLMPTERHGKVRRLLRGGKAHVVRLMPFTIQLDYESKRFRQEVSLGVDAGSVHIGVSATTEKKELFAAEVILRNDIVKKISDRRELRKVRRVRKVRHRKNKQQNRRREVGWLPPSTRCCVDSHLRLMRFINSLLPVTKTTIEVAQFDTQKINNDKIQGLEYQQGEQLGFWNVREYVLARDCHKCQHCKGKSGDKILNVHHIESRRTGGNAPNNLITLCETCHKAYHRGEFELKLKRGTSLRDIAVMNIMRWSLYTKAKDEFKNVFVTYGYITKHVRITNKIEKTHSTDAFCIASNINAKRISQKLKMRCVPRHSRVLHAIRPKKHGHRNSAIASHWLGKSRFQRFDTVKWNGIKCFIFGSGNGRAILRNIEGELIKPQKFTHVKYLEFVRRKKTFLIN